MLIDNDRVIDFKRGEDVVSSIVQRNHDTHEDDNYRPPILTSPGSDTLNICTVGVVFSCL